MSLSVGEANAVSTILRWIGVPSHAGATSQEVDVAFGKFVQTNRGRSL
jgi:hypothetical protein